VTRPAGPTVCGVWQRIRASARRRSKENVMETLFMIAIVFFIIALVAYVLGARGMAGMSAGIGRTLLFVFLVLAVILVIVGLVR
jgi:uncharacterized membrane protein YtjA (UPF0391 family)